MKRTLGDAEALTCQRCDARFVWTVTQGVLPLFCDPCRPLRAKERQASWRKANPERSRIATAQWRARNPEGNKIRQRLHRYGLTAAQYDALLLQQDKRCAICHTDDPGRMKNWCIDHCHTTGAVRGLLCQPCNLGLGGFRDNPAHLEAAIAYLERAGR